MSDLIDRGDVLGVISCFFEDSFIEDADVHCAELEREINRLLAVPRWVRCEDELPPMLYQAEGDDFCIDYSTLVLAYREASHDFYLARQMDDGHGATWGTDCFDELYGVTHWMPIEPPKEDE